MPLFTVAMAVLSALPFFEGAMVQIKIFLLMNLVPEIAGKIITVYMGQFAEAAGRLTTVSLVALLAMALATLFTVDRSLERDLARGPPPSPVALGDRLPGSARPRAGPPRAVALGDLLAGGGLAGPAVDVDGARCGGAAHRARWP